MAVLGPADPVNEGRAKRDEILRALIESGMDAFLPEDYVVDSDVSDTDQERILLRNPNVDWILVLDKSEGPLAELAAFQPEPQIARKSLVMHPAQYTGTGSFTANVLEQFPHRLPFSDEEFERCDLVRACEDRARAHRTIKWREELSARQF